MPRKIDSASRAAEERAAERARQRRGGRASTKGKARNGPKTFGSWKPPAARSNLVKSPPDSPK